MAIALTLAGVALIAAAVLDIFQTLFHPAGRGALSDWTARIVWKIARKLASRRPAVLTFAGPLALLSIITSWSVLTLLGFALIYLPRMAEYAFSPGINPARPNGFWEAVDSSIGALITLSQGMEPRTAWLGVIRGFEAIVGFGLLTASVSWLLSIYPVLEARRSVAQRASLLQHAELAHQIDMVRDCGERADNWVIGLAADLSSLRNQMAQFPITYYFHIGEPETSLAGALPYLSELADRAVACSDPAMRLAGTALGGAVEDFVRLLAEIFLRMPSDDKQAVLRAYSREHMSDMILLRHTVAYDRSERKAS